MGLKGRGITKRLATRQTRQDTQGGPRGHSTRGGKGGKEVGPARDGIGRCVCAPLSSRKQHAAAFVAPFLACCLRCTHSSGPPAPPTEEVNVTPTARRPRVETNLPRSETRENPKVRVNNVA